MGRCRGPCILGRRNWKHHHSSSEDYRRRALHSLQVCCLFLPETCQTIFSNANVDTSKPHLMFTNMGVGGNLPHLCYSLVGRVKTGEQGINLGQAACFTIGRIMHETMHALGMKVQFQKNEKTKRQFSGAIHEMMRWDRDAHMKILFDNLQPGLGARNFGEKSLDTHVTFSTPFDWHTWPDAIFTLSVRCSQCTGCFIHWASPQKF